MSRGIGAKQRRVLDLLTQHGQPLTVRDITDRLEPAQRFGDGFAFLRDANLSRVLTSLARRGLIHLEPGHWTETGAGRLWVPTRATLRG
jgi:hypothetical protein